VGAHRDAREHRELDGTVDHRRISGVKAAGNVGRRDDLQEPEVVAHRPGSEALAEVGVEVDLHRGRAYLRARAAAKAPGNNPRGPVYRTQEVMTMRAMLPMLVLLAVPAPTRVTPDVPAVKAAPALPSVAAKAPRVEVTFVLDTTGSMGGLIEGAKRRIWSIARRIGEGRPRPDLRIALVGYRDKGDEYVTRVHDLSGDMDEVYARLSAFRAEGGGDFPEHVSAALSDAVHRVSWSQDSALRLIFLVGDAPPHLDYQDGFDFRRHVREAAEARDRHRNRTVRSECRDRAGVREIASMGDGHYAQIDGKAGCRCG
jgi:hypothetical protein